jgi:hypothetical protein
LCHGVRPLAERLGELVAQGTIAARIQNDDVGDALAGETLQRDIDSDQLKGRSASFDTLASTGTM